MYMLIHPYLHAYIHQRPVDDNSNLCTSQTHNDNREHLGRSSASACRLHIDAEVRRYVARQSRGGTVLGIIIGARGGQTSVIICRRQDHSSGNCSISLTTAMHEVEVDVCGRLESRRHPLQQRVPHRDIGHDARLDARERFCSIRVKILQTCLWRIQSDWI